MCVLSIKVPIQKKSGNLFNDRPVSDAREIITLYQSGYKNKVCNIYLSINKDYLNPFLCNNCRKKGNTTPSTEQIDLFDRYKY